MELKNEVKIEAATGFIIVGIVLEIACYYSFLGTEIFFIGVLLFFCGLLAGLSKDGKYLMPIIISVVITAINFLIMVQSIDPALFESIFETIKIISIIIVIVFVVIMLIALMNEYKNEFRKPKKKISMKGKKLQWRQ